MKNTSVSIVNKLSSGLGELYADIDAEAKRLNIPYLVVGAMARDLVLVHGYGSKIERGTRDVDFGIKVETSVFFKVVGTLYLNFKLHFLFLFQTAYLGSV
jgi:hypothetical protein